MKKVLHPLALLLVLLAAAPAGAAVTARSAPFVLDTRSANQVVVSARSAPFTLDTRVPSQRLRDKVIMVAGGGEYLGNNIARQTRFLATSAHRVARARQFPESDILYLSAFAQEAPVDGPATLQGLEEALTVWARDARRLTLFLFDHGERAGEEDWLFILDGTTRPRQVLLASQLDQWLDTLQSGPDPLTDLALVIDMCYAGGFVARCSSAPPGRRRAIVASTAPDRLASYGGNVGELSFGYQFLSALNLGTDFQSAFIIARLVVEGLNTPRALPQRPLMDDDGDGRMTGLDGGYTSNWRFGAATAFAATPPEIVAARDNATLPAAADFSLWCQVGPDGADRVSAIVSYELPLSAPGDPIVGYDIVELTPDPARDNRWIGVAPAAFFPYRGNYTILYMATRPDPNDDTFVMQAFPESRTLLIESGPQPPLLTLRPIISSRLLGRGASSAYELDINQDQVLDAADLKP